MIKLPTKISILGTPYTICGKVEECDSNLNGVDAYCDTSVKEIVINMDYARNATIKNPNYYIKKVIRHEVIHAFMYESGLDEQATFDDAHFEQMVDWIAIQHEKIHAIYEELGVLGE